MAPMRSPDIYMGYLVKQGHGGDRVLVWREYMTAHDGIFDRISIQFTVMEKLRWMFLFE